ncbi:ABC transporter substrate-binding protein, partial [Candidatus Acetothermia bacterium]|nr:ABC transporter substrate-binding protein [Candidatus Acetothermia bacterium]
GDRVTMVRNEEYTWGPAFVKNPGPAHIERIVLKVIPEAMTRVMEFEDRAARGDAVTAMIPPADVLRLKADPDIQTLTTLVSGADILFINTTIWPFDDLRVREALIHAIDTRPVVEYVLEGLAVPAYTFISPTQIDYALAVGPIPPRSGARSILKEHWRCSLRLAGYQVLMGFWFTRRPAGERSLGYWPIQDM